MASYSGTVLLLLCSVFQVAHGYTYTYAGLVASSVVAFVLLVIALGILITVVTWEQWYPKFMYNRGKVKAPREIKQKPRSIINGGLSYTESELRYPSVSGSTRQIMRPGTPRSELMTAGTAGNKTDSWIQEIPTPRYEEGIQFDEEDDDEQVIVTEMIDIDDAKSKDTPQNQEFVSGHAQNEDPTTALNATYAVVSKASKRGREVNTQSSTIVTGQTSQHVTSGGDFFFGAESIEETRTDFRSPEEEEKMVLY